MSAAQKRGGDLQIIEERTMAAIPRGDEELRVTFTRARTGDGKEVAWHSVRVFWKNESGEWRPGKQGITIRGKELRPVADALAKATSGGHDSAAAPTASSPVAPTAKAASPVVPFGRSKGKALDAIEDDDLRWLEAALMRSAADPAKASYRARNECDLAGVRAEMEARFLR